MDQFKFNAEKSGKVLRYLRKIHHLTQNEIADSLGFERSKISSIESGRYKLTLEGYIRYLDFFRSKGEKITLEDLVRGNMPEEAVAYSPKNKETEQFTNENENILVGVLQEQIHFLRAEINRLIDIIASLSK